MPVAAATEQIVQLLVGSRGNDVDFAALLGLAAEGAGTWSSSPERALRSTTGSGPLEPVIRCDRPPRIGTQRAGSGRYINSASGRSSSSVNRCRKRAPSAP